MTDNPPAFPRTGEGFGNPCYDEAGMTLRDWFAGQALVAFGSFPANWNQRASDAYAMADAMLAARKEQA
jgi:hypothetical protein